MDQSSNIFSYFVGGLALISAIVSVTLYYRAYLPGAQMKVLDEVLRETNEMYEKANVEGLIPTAMTRKAIQERLNQLESSSASLRERTYNATTTFDEYMELLRGLSREIIQKVDHAKKLRALVISTTEEEKRRRLVNLRHSRALPGAESEADLTEYAASVVPTSTSDTSGSLVNSVVGLFRSSRETADLQSSSSTRSSSEQSSVLVESDAASLSSTITPDKFQFSRWSKFLRFLKRQKADDTLPKDSTDSIDNYCTNIGSLPV